MEWYFFALLTPAFWALNNVFIKFLLTKKFKSYLPMICCVILMDAIFAVAVLVVVPINVRFPYSLFALMVGLMPLLAFWFYSKALIIEEVSRIITLFQLIPVFIVILSAIFLDEVLDVQKYSGIIFIVIASMLISYKKSRGEKSFSSAFKFMIPFGLIIATYTILEKHLLEFLDFWSLFFWIVLGAFGGVIFLLCFSQPRKEFAKTISIVGKRTVFVTFIGEGLYVLGKLCSLVAMSLADVSLVSALLGLQPFYIFFYMLFLSLFLPKILEEEIGKSIVVLKIFAMALMFMGTWLVV
jgi:drug/metabolite transporter (DMT)-like permease